MKNSVLPQLAKAGEMNNVVFTYVDSDRQPALVSKLTRTNSVPQLIRYDRTKAGWKVQLLLGAKSPQETRAFINAELGRTNRPGKLAGSSDNAQKDDYTRAYNKSLASGRLLVVLLGARWCPACQEMKDSILPQVTKAGGLNNVEFAYVDFDRQPKTRCPAQPWRVHPATDPDDKDRGGLEQPSSGRSQEPQRGLLLC